MVADGVNTVIEDNLSLAENEPFIDFFVLGASCDYYYTD
jgi:hypothetical protein